jgi:hypothetical protein
VRIEEVDAPAMERHHRRVGRLEAVLEVHLQDARLRGWVPACRCREVCSMRVVRSTPSGPTTRAPSAKERRVPSRSACRRTGERFSARRSRRS